MAKGLTGYTAAAPMSSGLAERLGQFLKERQLSAIGMTAQVTARQWTTSEEAEAHQKEANRSACGQINQIGATGRRKGVIA